MNRIMKRGLQAAAVTVLAALAVAAMGCAGRKAPPPPAKAAAPPAPESPLPSRVQAVYFPADSRPLDKTSCGAWGEWVICFGPEPPTVAREECPSKTAQPCGRFVMAPLVCRHAEIGESPCQLIMTTFPPRKSSRDEACHVVGPPSLLMTIRCPERLRLGDAEVRRQDTPPLAHPAASPNGPVAAP